MVAVKSSSASQQLNLDTTTTDDQGKFEMTFEVTAFEETAYVELEAASSTASAAAGGYGVTFSVEDANTGAIEADGSNNPLLTRVSGGTVDGQFVKINAGQTATFKLTVNYDAAETGYYRVQMNQVGYSATAATIATISNSKSFV